MTFQRHKSYFNLCFQRKGCILGTSRHMEEPFRLTLSAPRGLVSALASLVPLSPYMRTPVILDQGSTLMTTFNLNYLSKRPTFKNSHIDS